MKTFLHSVPVVLLYSLFPANLLLLAYLLQPVTAQASTKWIGLFCVLYLGLALLTWLQARFWVTPLWGIASRRERITWSAAAALLGALCFVLLTPTRLLILEKFPLFAPQERLEIRPMLEQGENLTIQRIKLGSRQVLSSSISLQGAWQSEGLLLSTSDPGAYLLLSTRIPHEVNIVFGQSANAGRVVVSWAGKQETIDLHAGTNQEAGYSFNFDRAELPAVTLWIRLLTIPAWFGIALAASKVLFVSSTSSTGI